MTLRFNPQAGATAAVVPLLAAMSPIRLVLSGTAAVTASVVPAGTYKISLSITGEGLCYCRVAAAPTAVVPTDLADVAAANGPVLDHGESITFDGTTKISAILDANCTGKLALTRLF